MARTTDERLDCLMEQLEKGTQNIFESGRYAEYLAVMSKFHHYSFRNTILIFLQPQCVSCGWLSRMEEGLRQKRQSR